MGIAFIGGWRFILMILFPAGNILVYLIWLTYRAENRGNVVPVVAIPFVKFMALISALGLRLSSGTWITCLKFIKK